MEAVEVSQRPMVLANPEMADADLLNLAEIKAVPGPPPQPAA